MKKISLFFIALILLAIQGKNSFAQVEHVPIVHPVYNFLILEEAKGLLLHFSSSSLPLQRKEIVSALIKIREQDDELDYGELAALEKFEIEFEISNRNNSVVFYSASDRSQVLSSKFFSNDEKFFYHYKDSAHVVNISPLGSFDAVYDSYDDNSEHALMANIGLRLFGALSNSFGYYLQVTNGALLSGDRSAAMIDRRLQQNIKFADLESDFDFAESHVRFDYDWFYAIIGKENRLLGSGINQRLIFSNNAPPHDAVSLGARFSNFEYRFTHSSLLSVPESDYINGKDSYYPAKYAVTHRFALKPSWGEIAFWEHLIYSNRGLDLAYVNPISFYKSLEHSLHDRDNAIMGMDLTVRPFKGVQIKGTYFLDDIIISEIGNDYWSNKSAWNLALISVIPGMSASLGVEYARVEPYTFSHFDPQNSMTHDSVLYGSYLLPNSDEISLNYNMFFGGRYPLSIKLAMTRHGENEYDEEGNIVRNVGGDPLQAKRSEDSFTAKFMDGNVKKIYSLDVKTGWELIRGFNLQLAYTLRKEEDSYKNIIRLIFRFEDFY